MNRKNILLLSAAIAAVIAAAPLYPAAAADGTWTTTNTPASWSNALNWQFFQVASGIDATANFYTQDLTSDRTVHLDSSPTIGTLIAGDTTYIPAIGPNNWTFDDNSNPAIILTFDTSAGTATISANGGLVTLNLRINGSDGLQKIGNGGTLVLGGLNAYIGATTVTTGVLQIGNNGTAGSIPSGNLITNSTLAVSRSDTVIISQNISGTGGFKQIGSGNLILSGSSSYVGATTIAAGALEIANTGSIAGSSITVAAGTFLKVNLGGAIFNSPNLDLDGTATFNASTTIANLTGNGTLLQSGTLTITGPSGFFPGTIQNNGSSSASIVVTSGGVARFRGSNTYSGITTINPGGMISLDGSAGSFGTANVINNGAVIANRPDFTIANDISGSGTLRFGGFGSLILTGSNSYAGTSTIGGSAGTLQIGDNGTTGSLGTGDVVLFRLHVGDPLSSLSFRRSDTITIANNITGTGNLYQLGSGVTILTGSNTYSVGTTSISAGTLQIGNNGTIGTLGTGSVVDDSVLAFKRTDVLTVPSAISGAGQLQQLGTGTVILTGSNSYAGNTTISSGALQVGNNGSLGTLGTGPVVNNGILAFNRNDTIGVPNNISGSGGLLQNTGILILLSSNTYTGSTTIAGGVLQVGNGGAAGSLGSGPVVNNSIFAVNRSGILLLPNDISGSGALNHFGPGTLVLAGNNSYTGATSVLGGTLQIGNGGTTGSLGSGNVINNGVLAFNLSSNQYNVPNVISGTGQLQKTGGLLILTGDNTYSGTTTIASGVQNVLQIGNNGTTGSLGTGEVIDNSVLFFKRSNTIIVPNSISGPGQVVQLGAGSLVLTGVNSYSGITTINNGTLQIGNGGITGTLGSASVSDNGILAFNRSDTIAVPNYIFTFAPLMQPGQLQQLGSGTLILTGTNSYTGTTTVVAGTLQIGNNGTIGSLGTGVVINNTILAFNRSDTIAVPNDVSGTGQLQQLSAASLILTGVHAYTGDTAITQGRVVFSGINSHSIGMVTGAGALEVAANATLISDGVTTDSWTLNGSHAIRSNITNAGSSKVNTLTIAHSGPAYSGKLDLSNNKLIVQSDPTIVGDKSAKLAALNAALISGSNGSGGYGSNWNGNGITSSTITTPLSYGIGIWDNAVPAVQTGNGATFGGQTVDSNSILVHTAHIGDADGNGVVNIIDLSIVANAWQQPANNWAAGDLNGDGIVNIIDFTMVANNWQQTSSFPLESSPVLEFSTQSSSFPSSPVPEPTSLALFTLGALFLARRHRPSKLLRSG